MYNIEDLLKPTDPHENNYLTKTNLGKEYLSELNITFACLIRDVGLVIDSNTKKISDFAKTYSKSYNIVFFENDSNDNTKDKLAEIKQQYSNIEYISKNYNRPKFGPVKTKTRTMALAEYRTELQKFIQQNYTTDYIIVLDFDFIDLSINGMLNSFGWLSTQSNYSAIAGNSFQIRKVFGDNIDMWNYDSWAYRGSWWEDLTQYSAYEPRHYDPMLWFGLWIPPVGSQPFKVNSAFGGCCIYRSEYYYNGTYDGSDCEHVTFHKDLYDNKNFELYLNPSQIILFN